MNAPFVPTVGFVSAWPFGLLKPLHYRVIALDPPWKFNAGVKGRPQHYKRMTDAEIAALPLRALAHPEGCWIMLWITSPMDGPRFWENIWPAWKAQGVRYSSRAFVWIKTHSEIGEDGSIDLGDIAMNQGFTTRKNAEDVLLLKLGSPKRQAKDVREVIVSQQRENSRKPDEFFERVQAFAQGPYADVFSREERSGWDSFGDEVDKFTPAQGLLL